MVSFNGSDFSPLSLLIQVSPRKYSVNSLFIGAGILPAILTGVKRVKSVVEKPFSQINFLPEEI